MNRPKRAEVPRISRKLEQQVLHAISEAFGGGLQRIALSQHIYKRDLTITLWYPTKLERRWEVRAGAIVNAVKKLLPDDYAVGVRGKGPHPEEPT